jgi:hypothetical protein
MSEDEIHSCASLDKKSKEVQKSEHPQTAVLEKSPLWNRHDVAMNAEKLRPARSKKRWY